eukprot:CAMPEP_0183379246 /NCGR_PEP_ID=MMETSP0164_2-20130417/125322_1 /TAXON_ID=221442 /ORGANISM="Coccolithus pelagicus ssp braarudi, Strain PLY182g" /LENGTH=146 /DNA_ID=CAMNT_0025556827 /DNA_START=521 /DNA_END=962 /DNA_ORIENTATION=+
MTSARRALMFSPADFFFFWVASGMLKLEGGHEDELLRKHGVVLDLGTTQRRAVARNQDDFSYTHPKHEFNVHPLNVFSDDPYSSTCCKNQPPLQAQIVSQADHGGLSDIRSDQIHAKRARVCIKAQEPSPPHPTSAGNSQGELCSA